MTKVNFGVTASLGPLFVMPLVKINWPPGSVLAGMTDSETARSALVAAVTVVLAVSVPVGVGVAVTLAAAVSTVPLAVLLVTINVTMMLTLLPALQIGAIDAS